MSECVESCNKTWVPLESDPDVLNEYMYKIGVPRTVALQEVYGLDEEMLAFLPQPVLALLVLFPLLPDVEHARQVEELRLTGAVRGVEDAEALAALAAEAAAAQGQADDTTTANASADVCWLPQRIGNACGTMAIVHSILNLSTHPTHPVTPLPGSLLAKLAAQSSPLARAEALEADQDAATLHAEAAAQGVTDGEAAADTDVHYIALVERDGRLLELDGRKHGPIDVGAAQGLPQSALPLLQRYLALLRGDVHFAVLALCAAQE